MTATSDWRLDERLVHIVSWGVEAGENYMGERKASRSSRRRPMGRQRPNPKSDWVALDTYLREVVVKYQTWLRESSSSKQESEITHGFDDVR